MLKSVLGICGCKVIRIWKEFGSLQCNLVRLGFIFESYFNYQLVTLSLLCLPNLGASDELKSTYGPYYGVTTKLSLLCMCFQRYSITGAATIYDITIFLLYR
jgi:hypothetical protein